MDICNNSGSLSSISSGQPHGGGNCSFRAGVLGWQETLEAAVREASSWVTAHLRDPSSSDQHSSASALQAQLSEEHSDHKGLKHCMPPRKGLDQGGYRMEGRVGPFSK